jgi:glycosidase
MNHYQVNLRSFACSHPRNCVEALKEFRDGPALRVSPLAGLADGLDLLADLGVELLHIMPPFQMGLLGRKGIGSPYAVSDYSVIDPEFGTESEFFEVVRRAHRLGMKVILGYVPNHTARDHVWTQGDPENYIRDEQGELGYDFDWSDTAKLNYRHPPLRRAVTDMLKRWLTGECSESGVDGYRVDMAHMINDLSFWDECIPELEEAAGDRGLLLMAECYGFERNVDLFKRGFHAAYDDDFYKIAQYGYGRGEDGQSVLMLDPDAAHNGDFAPRLAEWRRGGIAAAVRGLIEAYQREAPDRLLGRYVDNHDEGRGLYRFGAGACRVMMDLAACMPGSIVFTLSGQEAGALNRPPIHEYIGLCDKGYRKPDGSRVDGIEFEGNLFLRTPEERAEAIREMRDRFALRKHHPALVSGSVAFLNIGEQAPESEHTVAAFVRDGEGERLACLFNLGHTDRRLSNPPSGETVYGDSGNEILPAFACRIVKLS